MKMYEVKVRLSGDKYNEYATVDHILVNSLEGYNQAIKEFQEDYNLGEFIKITQCSQKNRYKYENGVLYVEEFTFFDYTKGNY